MYGHETMTVEVNRRGWWLKLRCVISTMLMSPSPKRGSWLELWILRYISQVHADTGF